MQPFMISCPGCGTRFRVRTPNSLGQTRPCPKCAAPIEIIDPNAPLEPPKHSLPWNRWALACGTIAALLVVAGMLLISRGGAANSSLERAETRADASDAPQHDDPEAAADALEGNDPQADLASEQAPLDQETEPPTIEALEADLEHLLAESPELERTVPDSVGPPTADPRPSPVAPQGAAAPSAAERARSVAGATPNPSVGSQNSILGPKAAASSDAGDKKVGRANSADGTNLVDPAPAEAEPAVAETDDPVYHRLHRTIVLFECEKLPLEFLVEELSDLSALEVSLDYAALEALRIDFETPITLKLEDTNLAGILTAIVEPLELTYVVTGEKVLITAPSEGPDQDDEETANDIP